MNDFFVHINITLLFQTKVLKNLKCMLVNIFMFNTHVINYLCVDQITTYQVMIHN